MFTFLFLPPLFSPLQASCVSLINLYHSLVNCVTFTSCVWGAHTGKWNGSVVLQGQIHSLVYFLSSVSLLSPFHISLFHPFFRGGILKPKRHASEKKTRNIPHWPRETGNLPAPASGSEIKAVFEMSQKHCCCLTSCTCDRLATSTLLVSDTRKHSLWLGKRAHSQPQIM